MKTMATEKKQDPRTIKLLNVRLSFPHIYKPQEQENDDGTTRESFNSVFMVPKEDNPHLKPILAAMKAGSAEAKKKAWGGNEEEWPRIPASMTCFKDGDNDDHFTTPRAEYAGHYILSASSPGNRPPRVVTNRKGSDDRWIDAEPGKKNAPYAGCWVNAVVEVYGQKKDPKRKMPNRINASFSVVQFLKDGEAFGNSGADPDDILNEDDVSYEGDMGDDYEEGYGGPEEQEEDDLL